MEMIILSDEHVRSHDIYTKLVNEHNINISHRSVQ